MSRERINLICAELPGAEMSDHAGGGDDAWTVGGQTFARVGAVTPEVLVRCRDGEQAEGLIAAGVAGRAPDLHGPWVSFPLGAPESDLRHRIAESYALVRRALPEAVQVTLDRTSG